MYLYLYLCEQSVCKERTKKNSVNTLVLIVEILLYLLLFPLMMILIYQLQQNEQLLPNSFIKIQITFISISCISFILSLLLISLSF